MKFLKYLFTQTLLIHFIAAVAIAGALLWGTISILDVYSHHNQSFEVPDFTGLTISEVKKIIKEKNLRYEVTDSIYSNEYQKGTVVEQNPPPKFKVKENRKIFFTMNALTTEKVKVPDVTNGSLIQAKAELETIGLKIGRLTYRKDFAKNYIFEQKYKDETIAKGTYIEKGSYIDLVLGDGSEKDEDLAKTRVPNLHNLTWKEAKIATLKKYLNLGASTYDLSVKNYRDSARAKIWKQKPFLPSNIKVRLGTEINIWLTVDTNKLKKEQKIEIDSVSSNLDTTLTSAYIIDNDTILID